MEKGRGEALGMRLPSRAFGCCSSLLYFQQQQNGTSNQMGVEKTSSINGDKSESAGTPPVVTTPSNQHQVSQPHLILSNFCLFDHKIYFVCHCSLPPMALWSWSLVLEFTSPLVDWRRPWGTPRRALSWLGNWWMPFGINPHLPDLHFQQEANFSISSLTEK